MSTKKAKKAKAKKAQAKKAPEVKAAGRPSQLKDNAVIRVLKAKNPKRSGSAAHARFDLYKKDMTVAEFLAAGGWRADISWDLRQGFIEVVKPS